MTQCDRLEAELRKGRKLTKFDIDALLIGNHTGRLSELRDKGLNIKTEWIRTNQGRTGLYSLVDAQNDYPERIPGHGDAYEGE